LVCTGAFDLIENKRRAPLFHAIDTALEYARKLQESTSSVNSFLFGGEQSQEQFFSEPKLPEVEEWSLRQRLQKEKEFLNFYLSGHPLERYRNIMKDLTPFNLGDVDKIGNGTNVKLFGILSEIDVKIDRHKKKFAFAELEDFYGKAELVVWSESYQQFYQYLQKDSILFVSGKAEVKDNSIKVTATEIYPLDLALEKLIDSIHIYLRNADNAKEKLQEFAKLCNSIDSATKVLFFILYNGERKAFVSDEVHFAITEENIFRLYSIFGAENIKLVPKANF
jgi:DNA polymerase-3 subunit alpha